MPPKDVNESPLKSTSFSNLDVTRTSSSTNYEFPLPQTNEGRALKKAMERYNKGERGEISNYFSSKDAEALIKAIKDTNITSNDIDNAVTEMLKNQPDISDTERAKKLLLDLSADLEVIEDTSLEKYKDLNQCLFADKSWRKIEKNLVSSPALQEALKYILKEKTGVIFRQQDSLMEKGIYPKPTNDCLYNQTLTEIFPKMSLDNIIDETERNAYQNILSLYAQELHNKAKEAYSDIFKHYDISQIYYKWYGENTRELKHVMAIYNTRDNTISIGPSKSILLSRFGIDVEQYPVWYEKKEMQYALKHLRSNEKGQWAMYNILNPLYKHNEEHTVKQNNKIKKGPIGLYVTDNYTQLVQEFGGSSSMIPDLYNNNKRRKTTGPWSLPEGAIRRQPKTLPNPEYGNVFKLEKQN